MQILWSVNILICPIGFGVIITISALQIQIEVAILEWVDLNKLATKNMTN